MSLCVNKIYKFNFNNMSKFKSFFVMLFAVVLAGGVIVSCSDDDDDLSAEEVRAEGFAAGSGICACMDGYAHLAPNQADFITADGFDMEGYIAALGEYGWQAAGCVNLQAYQEYVAVNFEGYDPNANDPLLSVFTFTNDDFKAGFIEGIGGCAESFSALMGLIGQMQ